MTQIPFIQGRVSEGIQSSVLYASQLSLNIKIGNLEPGSAVTVCEGVEAAPTDYSRMELALGKEKGAGSGIQVWAVEVALVAGRLEGLSRVSLKGRYRGSDVFGTKPPAGFLEVFAEDLHDKVYHTSVGTTYETFVAVSPYMNRQAGVVVIVERA